MHFSKVTMFAVLGFLAAQFPTGQAQAQEQSAAGDDQLENVIVTAERRESDEQRTPTSVSVRSGSELRMRAAIHWGKFSRTFGRHRRSGSGPRPGRKRY